MILHALMAVVWLIYLCMVLKQPRIRQIDLTLPVLILILNHVVIVIDRMSN